MVVLSRPARKNGRKERENKARGKPRQTSSNHSTAYTNTMRKHSFNSSFEILAKMDNAIENDGASDQRMTEFFGEDSNLCRP